MTDNGYRSLDLTDLTESAHITAGETKFDLPMDMSLKVQGRIQRLVTRMQGDDVSDDEYASLEDELWALADEILAAATPHPGRPAREFLTKPAVFRLMGFLTTGYRSVRESMTPSPSPSPTAAPSRSET